MATYCKCGPDHLDTDHTDTGCSWNGCKCSRTQNMASWVHVDQTLDSSDALQVMASDQFDDRLSVGYDDRYESGFLDPLPENDIHDRCQCHRRQLSGGSWIADSLGIMHTTGGCYDPEDNSQSRCECGKFPLLADDSKISEPYRGTVHSPTKCTSRYSEPAAVDEFSIKYRCDLCQEWQGEAGAIIIGPTDGSNRVEKSQICRSCYDGILTGRP